MFVRITMYTKTVSSSATSPSEVSQTIDSLIVKSMDELKTELGLSYFEGSSSIASVTVSPLFNSEKVLVTVTLQFIFD